MLKGIRARLVLNYALVIFITVAVLEALLIFSLRLYYEQNIENTLTKQAQVSAGFYERYLADGGLAAQSSSLLSSFAANTAAQVQIIDSSGRIMQDSTGIITADSTLTPDVQSALQGSSGRWKGIIAETGEPVLSISYPMRANEQIVGAVKYAASLSEMNRVITRISYVIISVGLFVVAAAILISLVLSRTIIGPVKQLTSTALKMAEGQYQVRAHKKYNDELGTLAETFNVMAGEIERNERLKNEFIASISHELRTPLTSIKGWAVTLRSEATLPALREEGLQIIEQETDRLSELVEELLDFSKLEAGKTVLRLEQVDVNKLLQYIASGLMPRANRLGVELSVEQSEQASTIKADPNRLKQVLLNIADNALKFAPHGGRVVFSAFHHPDGVSIQVRDNGIGIPAEELPNVTKKFYKGHSKASGSGIGLAVSSQLVQLHGGELTVHSTEGKGTVVVIRLPSS